MTKSQFVLFSEIKHNSGATHISCSCHIFRIAPIGFVLGQQISQLSEHKEYCHVTHLLSGQAHGATGTALFLSILLTLPLEVSTQGWIHWWHNMSFYLLSLFCFLHSDETWRKNQETAGRWISGKGFTRHNAVYLCLANCTPHFHFILCSIYLKLICICVCTWYFHKTWFDSLIRLPGCALLLFHLFLLWSCLHTSK